MCVRATTVLSNVPISVNMSSADLAKIISQRELEREPLKISFVNLYSLSLANNDERLRSALSNFDFNLPDGSGIVLLSRLLNRVQAMRLAGPDFMQDALGNGLTGVSHFLLGGDPADVKILVEKLRNAGVDVRGYYCPPVQAQFSTEVNDLIIKKLNDAQADVVWVSFGCPKQEKWIAENADRVQARAMLGVGAAFLFLSNRVKRAPVIMRRMGLEWIFRFASEPKKVFPRLTSMAIFCGRILVKRTNATENRDGNFS